MSIAPEDRGPFWTAKNTSLLELVDDEAFDLLHPEAAVDNPHPTLTETQYFSFSIPEANINCFCYLWHHPNLGCVTGGVFASQGINYSGLQCDLFDMITYAPESCFVDDLRRVVLTNGYTVTILEPLMRYHLGYEDTERGNRMDVTLEAITRPLFWSSGKHFEQALRARGELVLRGKSYEVDSYALRDRSWGQLRPEDQKAAPPMDWMNGVFDDDFCFGCTAFDDEGSDPDWQGILKIPGSGDPVTGGWVYHEGVVKPIVTATKRTVRDMKRMFPISVEMELVDADGGRWPMRGEIVSAAPWKPWPNIDSIIALARWECRGKVGYGDFQQFTWNDYTRLFMQR
jgi:hypothetical protein